MKSLKQTATIRRSNVVLTIACSLLLLVGQAHADCNIHRSKLGAKLIKLGTLTARYDEQAYKVGLQMKGFAGSRAFTHISGNEAEAVGVLAYKKGQAGKLLTGFSILHGKNWISAEINHNSVQYVTVRNGKVTACESGSHAAVENIEHYLLSVGSNIRFTEVAVPDPKEVSSKLGL